MHSGLEESTTSSASVISVSFMVVEGVQSRGRRGLAERVDAGSGWLMMTVLTDNTIHWSVNDQ
jgi:hypothetical protein